MNRFNPALLPLFFLLSLVSFTAQAETLSAMETASNAPEADKRAVRPHLEALRSATTANTGD